MRTILLFAGLAGLTLSLAVLAGESPAPDRAALDALPIRDEAPVVVTGVQPGPGLWKVSRGDHVMWVLGTVSPLPKGMEWEARDVRAVLAAAQEVIWSPRLVFGADVGFFQGLLLAPKALGARKNPDGATLRQVVPTDMYARWQVLKQRYMGNDRRVEQWRPLFAATELYEAAMDDVGLVGGGVVAPVIERSIKARKPKQTSPTYKLVIADPKAALDEFRQARLDDLDCFGKTLQRLETDLDAMRLRANAWAVGDIGGLRALPYSDQNEACMRAAMQSGAMRKRAPADVDGEVRKVWLAAAEQALATNQVTFALLPMRELLGANGYLAALAARGYAVESPEAREQAADVVVPGSDGDGTARQPAATPGSLRGARKD